MKTVPKGVRGIGIFFEVLSFFPFIAGVALLFSNNASRQIVNSLGVMKSQNLTATWPIGLTFIMTGLIVFLTAYYLIKGKKWAWWTMLVLLILNGLSQLANLSRGWLGFILIIWFVYYLSRKDIREEFN